MNKTQDDDAIDMDAEMTAEQEGCRQIQCITKPGFIHPGLHAEIFGKDMIYNPSLAT